MRHISLMEGYEGVHLSINNFPVRRDVEINGLLATYVKLQGVKTEARDLLAREIVRKLEASHE